MTVDSLFYMVVGVVTGVLVATVSLWWMLAPLPLGFLYGFLREWWSDRR